MKKVYSSPEAEIEKFVIEQNVFCTMSHGGNDGGDTPIIIEDPDF